MLNFSFFLLNLAIFLSVLNLGSAKKNCKGKNFKPPFGTIQAAHCTNCKKVITFDDLKCLL